MSNYSSTTEEYNAWRQIDMNNTIDVDSINIWNRTSETNELSGFWVSVSQDAFVTGVALSTILADPNVSSYYITGTAGRPTTIPAETQ